MVRASAGTGAWQSAAATANSWAENTWAQKGRKQQGACVPFAGTATPREAMGATAESSSLEILTLGLVLGFANGVDRIACGFCGLRIDAMDSVKIARGIGGTYLWSHMRPPRIYAHVAWEKIQRSAFYRD